MFKNRFLIVVGVLSLSLVAMVISVPPSNTPTSAARGRAADAETENLARSRTADADRWEAMARYYQQFGGGASLNLLRSRAADTARWTAMAEYYQKRAEAEAQNLARARAADAARWTAMAEYYARFGATTP